MTTTYFAEGLPYTIVNSAADALFTVMGMSLSSLGLTTVLHLPWNLKFLWGPFVDQFETKRRWLLATEVLVCLVLLVLTITGGDGAPVALLAALFMVLAVASATHDIAVDGFYLEGLDDAGQSRYVGYRAGAYRVAMLAVNGPLLGLAYVTGWRIAWLAALVTMMVVTAYHAVALPRPEVRQRPIGELFSRLLGPRMLAILTVLTAAGAWGWRAQWWGLPERIAAAFGSIPVLGAMSLPGWLGMGLLTGLLLTLAMLERVRGYLARHRSDYADAFVVFLSKPRVNEVLAFVVLYRVGESFLQKMRFPFLNRELDVSMGFYSFANGTVGFIATIAATLLGGWLIARHGLRRWIWPFVIAQNVLNLLYAGLAFVPDPSAISGVVITVVIAVEHIGAGLGTAVFMVYLMRCCDAKYKAAHMALLTALMSVGYTLAGVASGALAEVLGYGPYFLLTFVATIPSMVLLLVVPYVDR